MEERIKSTEQQELTGVELFKAVKEALGADFATGLPCGELREFIDRCYTDNEILHVTATNEREAVGIAAGAWLAGRTPFVYMQNSGFFLASNDIGSLIIPCKMPIAFVASWRGVPGETATQHHATGAATEPLLQAFGMDYIPKPTGEGVARLKHSMDETQMPVCILKERTRFNTPPSTGPRQEENRQRGTVHQGERILEPLSREQVLSTILPLIPKSTAVVSSTGLISRSIFEHSDGPNQFYNAGAFGLTSSIALGFATSRPDVPTVAIEGDGSLLANIGNLNLIGHYAPSNFIHIVLDNRAYGSCSGEPTFGSSLIPELACQFGYSKAYSVWSEGDIRKVSLSTNDGQGPQMLHININTQGKRSFRRPVSMAQYARRFRKHFAC